MINPYWNKTLTIYTRYYDEENHTTKWYRYEVYNCFYGVKEVNVLKGVDIVNNNMHIARIPYSEDYLTYKQWCESSDKANHLSITKGSIIINGIVNESIADNSSGNNLLKKYAEKCFKLSIFKENDTYVLKHYYAGGD